MRNDDMLPCLAKRCGSYRRPSGATCRTKLHAKPWRRTLRRLRRGLQRRGRTGRTAGPGAHTHRHQITDAESDAVYAVQRQARSSGWQGCRTLTSNARASCLLLSNSTFSTSASGLSAARWHSFGCSALQLPHLLPTGVKSVWQLSAQQLQHFDIDTYILTNGLPAGEEVDDD